jgi:preprotein translocase subunit SecA
MAFLKGIFSKGSSVDKWLPLVDKVNILEPEFEKLSQDDFPKKTGEFKKRLSEGETLDNLLPEAFALVREASRRTLGQRHFDVQVLGAIAMHNTGISEMKTGEGKTLVATMPAYLNALTGKGVHVVTVNDYLSRRDAVWMGQIYAYLGLSIGILNHQASFIYDPTILNKSEDKERDEIGSFHIVDDFLRPTSKQEAYLADITYGTNSEFGFDYLRDNLLYNPADPSQRGFYYAIVDEVDSILIDEARTPLIISGNTGSAGELYTKFAGIARELQPEEHYAVDEKYKTVSLNDAGIERAEKLLGIDNIYAEGGVKYVHHLETAVRAKANYLRDTDYVVKDNEIIIVDPFTGRLQPGRRWSEGLHQAIEAKEGVRIKDESRTFASITYQNFFRMYEKLSGMTGTAETSKEEFYKVYGLDTYVIPTNRPVARIDRQDLIYQSTAGKMKAIAKKVKDLNMKGQPVLIGTVSIENNELLSDYLKSEGVRHEILNAKNHEREGEIIAQAGKRGAVTIATNMAGRGVDIKLGGNPTTPESYEEVKSLGGLFVLGTERHDARRIDNQLRGRAGRQGDPGETQFFVSLEDNLMRIFAVDTIKSMMGRFNIPEDEPIENKLITGALEKAQAKIEGFNFDARKGVLDYDNVLNYQRLIIYDKRKGILRGGKTEIEEYLNEASTLVEPELGEKTREKITTLLTGDKEAEALSNLKRVILQTMDMFWVDHLEVMDYLRGSVNLRAYGQRDPLVEYKRDGLRMFKEMEGSIAHQICEFVSVLEPNLLVSMAIPQGGEIEAGAKELTDTERNTTLIEKDEVGRNDLCPCGSGKKYKKCGLLNTPEHQENMAKKK